MVTSGINSWEVVHHWKVSLFVIIWIAEYYRNYTVLSYDMRMTTKRCPFKVNDYALKRGMNDKHCIYLLINPSKVTKNRNKLKFAYKTTDTRASSHVLWFMCETFSRNIERICYPTLTIPRFMHDFCGKTCYYQK